MDERTSEDPAQEVRSWLAGGENYRVEFKSERRKPLNDRDLVEVVVCLANGAGGVLLIGVEDDGTPTGARPRHEGKRTDPSRVQALIANNTQPAVATKIDRLVGPGNRACHGHGPSRSRGKHRRAPAIRAT